MFSHLNDDCLLQIFKLLALEDQVVLTEVCQRFQILIVECIWSRQYINLNTQQMKSLEPLSLQQYKKFFKANRENINKLKVVASNSFAYVYNPFNRLNERPDCEFYIALKMPNLKELSLPHERLHDRYIKLLSENCPKLEYLDFSDGLITDKYVKDMKNLKGIKFGNYQLPLFNKE